jgi:hypothetical protein
LGTFTKTEQAMLTPDKAELLKSFLGSLPERMAARLAKAVEVDRLADGAGLPHDVILEGLRPVLRQSETGQRTPDPLRSTARARKSRRGASCVRALRRCGTGSVRR